MHLAWRSILEVGVAEIDDDHRHIIDLLNRIQEASADDDRELSLGMLAELRSLLAAHFAREELLMVGLHYDGIESHRSEHERQFLDVQQKIAELAAGRIVAGAVSLHLQRRLLRHIEVADRQLGAAIRRHRHTEAAKGSMGACLQPPLGVRPAVPEAKLAGT